VLGAALSKITYIRQETTIWHQLESWSKEFPSWQKFILANAIRHAALDDKQVDQCYSLFLHHFHLAGAPQPAIEVPESVTGRPPSSNFKVNRLNRIHSLQGVNALPPTAELTFSPSLTVIFGRNGAGKSGFARILSNVCFSRMQHPILPNIYDQSAHKTPMAAIEIADSNGEVTSFTFGDGSECPDLKAFAVFDTAQQTSR
jgi:hypothetical protein